MIKELAKRATLSRSPSKTAIISKALLNSSTSVDIRLHAIYGIESLVQEQADCTTGIDPGWAVRIQVRVVPHNGEEINYHEHESAECDLPKQAGN